MKELRCLVFAEHELLNAIIGRRRKIREPLPTGTIKKVSFEQGDETVTTMHLVDDYGAESSMRFGAIEVCAALVNYCIERRIPLPAAANKQLNVLHGSMALMITLQSK